MYGRSDYYILNEQNNIVPVPMLEWAQWLETNFDHKRIAYEEFGPVRVSTVFIGLDYNFLPEGPPLLFETMIFKGKHDQYQERYATFEEAKAGHEKAVALVKESL